MEKLIIHTGMHKTGSSSIQDTLAAALNHPEYHYFSFDGRPNSSQAILQGFHYNNPGKQRMRESISSSLQSCKANIGIISAEGINRLVKKNLIELFAVLKKHADTIQVVSYVREPRGRIESSFQEVLKVRAVAEPINFAMYMPLSLIHI